MKCLICGKKITKDELTYEDYFKVFRGNNNLTYKEDTGIEGFICFRCLKETKWKNIERELRRAKK